MNTAQEKLAEAKEELLRLNACLKNLEDEKVKAEARKNDALERYVTNKSSLKDLKNEVKENSRDIAKEEKNTRDLIDLIEKVIENQTKAIQRLQAQIKEVKSEIWYGIADVYQKKIENVVGDTVGFLLTAISGANANDLVLYINKWPDRLKFLASAYQEGDESIREKLWREYVEEPEG